MFAKLKLKVNQQSGGRRLSDDHHLDTVLSTSSSDVASRLPRTRCTAVDSGYSTTASSIVGHSPVGMQHLATGHVPVAQFTGLMATGCTTTGSMTTEHTTMGYTAVEFVSGGHVATRHIATGITSSGCKATGHNTTWHNTIGQITTGQTTTEHIDRDHMATGHTTTGYVAAGCTQLIGSLSSAPYGGSTSGAGLPGLPVGLPPVCHIALSASPDFSSLPGTAHRIMTADPDTASSDRGPLSETIALVLTSGGHQMTTEKCDDGATAVSSLTEVDWTSSAECRDKRGLNVERLLPTSDFDDSVAVPIRTKHNVTERSTPLLPRKSLNMELNCTDSSNAGNGCGFSIASLEQERQDLQRQLKQLRLDYDEMSTLLEEKQNRINELEMHAKMLKQRLSEASTPSSNRVVALETMVEQMTGDLLSARDELESCRSELSSKSSTAYHGHDDLVLRNAHLSQRVTCLEQDVVRQAADAERRLAERDDVLGGQTATIARLRETTEALETRVMELQSARQVNGSTPQMESTILNLQTRLADKSRELQHTVDMVQDLKHMTNFQYLKHVVLKFMLSREPEAIQLIRAVAALLDFSQQEQQLIQQTLEWKMSWFVSRPSMGKGQMSKVIPPTF